MILALGLWFIVIVLFVCFVNVVIKRGRAGALLIFRWTLRFIFLVIFTFGHLYTLHRAVAPAIGAGIRRDQPIFHPEPRYWKEEGRLPGVAIQVLGWPLHRLNAFEMSEASHDVSSRRTNFETDLWRRFWQWDFWLNSLFWGIALTALLDFAVRWLARLFGGHPLRDETA